MAASLSSMQIQKENSDERKFKQFPVAIKGMKRPQSYHHGKNNS